MKSYSNKDFEMSWLWIPFHNEQVRLLSKINKSKSCEENRTFARSLFSMIEGISYWLRQILLERNLRKEIVLLPEETIILSEVSLNIDQNGKIKKNEIFFYFESLFKFTFKTYCKYYEKTEIYDKYLSDNRFSHFKESIKIRNRISHPKSGKDVFVNGEDVIKIDSAHEWFHEFVINVFKGDIIIEKQNKNNK
jgi:hypothetical protein